MYISEVKNIVGCNLYIQDLQVRLAAMFSFYILLPNIYMETSLKSKICEHSILSIVYQVGYDMI